MARNSGQKLNIVMLLLSALVAAGTWFVVYGFKEDLLDMGSPLTIGILCAVFLLVISLVVLLVSKLMGTFRADVSTGERTNVMTLVKILICTVACLGVMFGFEWLYETDISSSGGSSDTYIFIVDDSGSTVDTDPNQLRFKAIREIMQEKKGNTQFAIYAFADDVKLLQPMQKVSEGIPKVEGNSYGMTSIKAALDQVITDYEQGRWNTKGNVQVILITDGLASDIVYLSEIDPILARYRRHDISVSSVGLDLADESLMTKIADDTNGVFIDITEVDEMGDAVKSAVSFGNVERDLFSDRNESSYNVLPGIMRIVFVGILGVLVALAAAFAYGNSATFWFTVIAGTIKAFVASIFLEVGICLIGMPEKTAGLIAMILIGMVLTKIGDENGRTSSGISRHIDFDD